MHHEIIGPLLKLKETDQKPKDADLTCTSYELRQLYQQWDQLVRSKGWQTVQEDGGNFNLQLIVPSTMQASILQEIHAGVTGGHLKKHKTFQHIQE